MVTVFYLFWFWPLDLPVRHDLLSSASLLVAMARGNLSLGSWPLCSPPDSPASCQTSSAALGSWRTVNGLRKGLLEDTMLRKQTGEKAFQKEGTVGTKARQWEVNETGGTQVIYLFLAECRENMVGFYIWSQAIQNICIHILHHQAFHNEVLGA